MFEFFCEELQESYFCDDRYCSFNVININGYIYHRRFWLNQKNRIEEDINKLK